MAHVVESQKKGDNKVIYTNSCEQYISKTAVVAGIEDWKQHTLKCGYPGQGEYEEGNKQGRLDTCEKILSFLDTIEVKEVNIESMADKYYDALIDAEFNTNIAGHCRLAYYMGARDMLNKIK